LEQDNIYDQLQTMTNPAYTGPWWGTNPDWTLAHTQIKTFLCPSDITPGVPLSAGSCALMHSYQPPGVNGSAGVVMYYFGGVSDLGKTNYTGIAGPGWAHGTTSAPSAGGANYSLYTGIFTNRSRVKITDVIDGTSNTLMFGEGLGRTYPGSPDFQWTWMGTGAMATFNGLKTGGTSPPGILPQNATEITWAGFSSLHTGVVQFVFADGSVRAINGRDSYQRLMPTSAAWYSFQALSGMRDNDLRMNDLLN
jgi:prepilin-type processing-associated H-X9-DG protein